MGAFSRREDALETLLREARAVGLGKAGVPDQSELDAVLAICDRSEEAYFALRIAKQAFSLPANTSQAYALRLIVDALKIMDGEK